jgi:DNA-binding transcriptional ArsR family regulator
MGCGDRGCKCRFVLGLLPARELQSAISESDEMADGDLADAAATLKTLAHPARLRLLAMLRAGGLCVCQAAAATGSPFSTVSEHLGELKRAGLLVERREGRWVTYQLAETREARAHLRYVFGLIGGDSLIRKDERLVRKVRRVPPVDLCEAGLDLRSFGLEPTAS